MLKHNFILSLLTILFTITIFSGCNNISENETSFSEEEKVTLFKSLKNSSVNHLNLIFDSIITNSFKIKTPFSLPNDSKFQIIFVDVNENVLNTDEVLMDETTVDYQEILFS